ncbi:zinc finger protein 317-like, partial [Colletes gigas]|uniref:zinc finger protein 317-like n=1 Tax=Colletes gigas TaxID=935657 RepID=UPI001C9B60D1
MGQDKTLETNGILSETENRNTIQKSDVPFAQAMVDEKRYKCTYIGCNAAFVRPNRLARHIRFHTGERNYICTYAGCDKAYTNSSHLKRHMETHCLTKKMYQCPECPSVVSNLHNLKRHYNLMHGDHGKLTCTECGQTFTKKYHLATHMITHTGVKHKCDQCNRSFTNIRTFKRHKENHVTRKKRYSCTVSGCSEIFEKWLLLCAHLKTQHVIYYRCKDCDKVFLSKYHLKVHSQVHIENRSVIPCPYDKCPRVYYFKKNLDFHIKINHLGLKYQCDICKVEISSKFRLSEHIQKFHMSEERIKRTKKLQRKKRKDAGSHKKSAVSALVGVNLPPKLEKVVLKRKENIVCL